MEMAGIGRYAVVVFATRAVIGILLVVAGILKAHDGPVVTATFIAGYRILPSLVVAPLALMLPYVEILLGAYLSVGLFLRIVAWLAAAQFIVFSIAVASLVVRGIAADCGCFGSGVPTPPSWWHVMADLALAAACVWVARDGSSLWSVDTVLAGDLFVSSEGISSQSTEE